MQHMTSSFEANHITDDLLFCTYHIIYMYIYAAYNNSSLQHCESSSFVLIMYINNQKQKEISSFIDMTLLI